MSDKKNNQLSVKPGQDLLIDNKSLRDIEFPNPINLDNFRVETEPYSPCIRCNVSDLCRNKCDDYYVYLVNLKEFNKNGYWNQDFVKSKPIPGSNTKVSFATVSDKPDPLNMHELVYISGIDFEFIDLKNIGHTQIQPQKTDCKSCIYKSAICRVYNPNTKTINCKIVPKFMQTDMPAIMGNIAQQLDADTTVINSTHRIENGRLIMTFSFKMFHQTPQIAKPSNPCNTCGGKTHCTETINSCSKLNNYKASNPICLDDFTEPELRLVLYPENMRGV